MALVDLSLQLVVGVAGRDPDQDHFGYFEIEIKGRKIKGTFFRYVVHY